MKERTIYAKALTSSTSKSDGVSVYQNTANVLTDIFVAKTPKGLLWRYLNGAPIIMKLYDSSGNELPSTTEIVFGYRRPGDSVVTPLAEGLTYDPWSKLTLNDQHNINKQGFIRVYFNHGDDFDAEEEVEFVIQIKSDTQVAWTGASVDSEIIFKVEERQKTSLMGTTVYV